METTWKRYRFNTKAEDYRPVVFNPSYPWWCSGFAGDESYSIIVAYLPDSEDLLKYWPEAEDIDSADSTGPEFTERFPKPKYYMPLRHSQKG